jgi:hypothetical protein
MSGRRGDVAEIRRLVSVNDWLDGPLCAGIVVKYYGLILVPLIRQKPTAPF